MNRESVTRLLGQWQQGDTRIVDRVLPLIYRELHRLARGHLQSERHNHTLQPTALVHEAYLKLVDQTQVSWQGRNHFLAVASLAMRRLLVDHARALAREKRGGDQEKLSLTASLPVASNDQAAEIVAIDELLEKLAGFDERAARVVECRFFGGLSIEDTAAALDISPMTVKRAWRLARAWLRREMNPTD
ncbi:MAG: sigma-70 family RNA polymerase sigma factor [bacterium]